MKNYRDFNTEDFVWDINFRNWVLSPNREVNAFWEKWLEANPEKTPQVEKAKSIVKALVIKDLSLEKTEVEELVKNTVSKIDEQENNTTKKIRWFSTSKNQWLKVAALIAIIIGLGITYHQLLNEINEPKGIYEKHVAANPEKLIEVKNDHESPLPIQLIDGSLVLLKKGSKISYLKQFEGNNREIYLSGEAFFEVTKNPEKPFLVYANGLITKVLGTSFTVRAYDKEKEVTVEVKTGKVSVFAQSDTRVEEKATSRELKGVVLTPNQKIVYAREEVRMDKLLVELPKITIKKNTKPQFEFEDTPVSEVLQTLEKAYSIDIVFDEELLSNCPLTASLTDLQLFDKLDIICKGVEARYEILDGQIVIYSKGCK
ncbi:FecR family protein [Arcicella aquatica]|uniref:FecR family protein n=1 Tax=Arcicella aquatica TaxID=217141 RepID=A0ABU5QL66_9BACT|nr:FecR family protein [Arcicella aquatica]MEA5257484.1 FecR family protein [Arcicella aquatica]